MRTAHQSRPPIPPQSAFAGFRFPPDVIVLAVRWYLRFGLSYRDVGKLLAERGVEVDHVTIYRWVLLRRWPGGGGMCTVRSISLGRSSTCSSHSAATLRAARRFFERAIGTTRTWPLEVVTDRALAAPAVLEELLPAAWHRTEGYANNHYELSVEEPANRRLAVVFHVLGLVI